MGEELQEVEQLDMGEEDVSQGAVVIPAKEYIIGFNVVKTKSDRKWCRFGLTTDQRTLSIEPGSLGVDGQAKFDDFCVDVKDMFQTLEGQAVLAKLKALLRQRPLQVSTVVSE